MYQKPFF